MQQHKLAATPTVWAQEPSGMAVVGTAAQRLKNHAALQFLQAWRTEEAQAQYETWTAIKTAVEEDRLSDRSLLR